MREETDFQTAKASWNRCEGPPSSDLAKFGGKLDSDKFGRTCRIKGYLTHPPVLRAPKTGVPFKIYVAAQERVMGAVLTQEDNGKEFAVAYISRRLLDAKSRHVHLEKLCLALYYACSKFRQYILSSTCVVACSMMW